MVFIRMRLADLVPSCRACCRRPHIPSVDLRSGHFTRGSFDGHPVEVRVASGASRGADEAASRGGARGRPWGAALRLDGVVQLKRLARKKTKRFFYLLVALVGKLVLEGKIGN
jgi:hypothetical protein